MFHEKKTKNSFYKILSKCNVCVELQKNKKKRIQNDTSGIEAWRSCIGSPSDTELSEPNESVSKSEKY